jgi:hypothetical protein
LSRMCGSRKRFGPSDGAQGDRCRLLGCEAALVQAGLHDEGVASLCGDRDTGACLVKVAGRWVVTRTGRCPPEEGMIREPLRRGPEHIAPTPARRRMKVSEKRWWSRDSQARGGRVELGTHSLLVVGSNPGGAILSIADRVPFRRLRVADWAETRSVCSRRHPDCERISEHAPILRQP